jgi:hypothetical protein
MTSAFFRSQLPILLATLFAPLAITVAAQSDGWNGIIPLVSDRDDVEMILGPCPTESLFYCLYKLETENVHVSFQVDRRGTWFNDHFITGFSSYGGRISERRKENN